MMDDTCQKGKGKETHCVYVSVCVFVYARLYAWLCAWMFMNDHNAILTLDYCIIAMHPV